MQQKQRLVWFTDRLNTALVTSTRKADRSESDVFSPRSIILLLQMGIERFQLFENNEENNVPWAQSKPSRKEALVQSEESFVSRRLNEVSKGTAFNAGVLSHLTFTKQSTTPL